MTPKQGLPGLTGSRAPVAESVLTLTQLALVAPDLPSGVTPTLHHLVQHTAAVGSAYFQADTQRVLSYHVRAASGEMPQNPGMQAIAAHGLPADMPLMRALESSHVPLFFDDTQAAPETEGFSPLGVTSLAAAPVRRANGQLIGAFLMHTFKPHTWAAEEAALFSLVSGTIAALAGRLAAEEAAHLARESALRALGLALEARDGETQGHTDRVTALALKMADRLKLSARDRESLQWGAYLHDIGKIAIPDAILLKPGRLTPQEWDVMRSHVQEGQRFAQALRFLPAQAMEVIVDHHERWNGEGYPARKAGAQISMAGRIFALCDVYDALTSERPYKQAWTVTDARAELLAQAGHHFDPELVHEFLGMLDDSMGPDQPWFPGDRSDHLSSADLPAGG
ncbi:phosphohydrolase [Deinococcus malanensis]|uniref:Phosphohydrolase n=1 Tax=Deinococcus malanensis TaxID=1706855 RepID=A0ABQ2EP85_9DEIO|nr:HD domain-containing phosphohydrolase [Deinococcus malanensis]GGK19157.1 phosphohydrolase [Deinococcus malanensis]